MGDCIWIHYARPRPHWYSLDESVRADRQVAWRSVADDSRRKGGVCLGNYHVRGQHDFETVEIWRFPNAESVFEHWSALTGAAYAELYAFANNIGLAAEAPP